MKWLLVLLILLSGKSFAISDEEVRLLNSHTDERLDLFRATWSLKTDPNKRLPWVLYGRAYLVNFQSQPFESRGIEWGFRRTGPAVHGRIYVGIRKQF